MKSFLKLVGLAAGVYAQQSGNAPSKYHEITDMVCRQNPDNGMQASQFIMPADTNGYEFDSCDNAKVLGNMNKTYDENNTSTNQVSRITCDVGLTLFPDCVLASSSHVSATFKGTRTALENELQKMQKNCFDAQNGDQVGDTTVGYIVAGVIGGLLIFVVVPSIFIYDKCRSKKANNQETEKPEIGNVELQTLTLKTEETFGPHPLTIKIKEEEVSLELHVLKDSDPDTDTDTDTDETQAVIYPAVTDKTKHWGIFQPPPDPVNKVGGVSGLTPR